MIPNVLYENTQDKVITAQARQILANLDYILAENLRTARRFIASLNTGRPVESYQMELANKDLTRDMAVGLMQPLLKGRDAGILSEAGCPGIADPGSLLVKLAHRYEISVVPVSGPSSIFLALMASGFNGQKFAFHGYLPIDKKDRGRAIRMLEKNAMTGETQIFMETPYRNNQLMKDLLFHCQPSTLLCVAKNLTGEREWIKTKSIEEWKKEVPELNKEPCIFLLHVN